MKAKVKNEGKKFDEVQPGSYPARVVGVVDIGLQARKPWGDKVKAPINQVMFFYELVDEFLKDDDGNDMEDKPRFQSEKMSFYGPEATKSVIGARFAALDPSGATDGDVSRLVNTPCMVTIVHTPGKEGRVWTNVESVGPMRPRDVEKCPALVNTPFVFDMDNPDMEAFERIPAWVKKLITGSLGYASSPLAKLLENSPKKAEKGSTVTAEDQPEFHEDENPF